MIRTDSPSNEAEHETGISRDLRWNLKLEASGRDAKEGAVCA